MNQKNDLLSGAGTAWEIVRAITLAVKKLGGSDDDVKRILREEDTVNHVAGLLMKRIKPVAFSQIFVSLGAVSPRNFSGTDYLKLLQDFGISASEEIRELFVSWFFDEVDETEPNLSTFEIVLVPVKEMGKNNFYLYSEIVSFARSNGLSYFPLKVIPEIMLHEPNIALPGHTFLGTKLLVLRTKKIIPVIEGKAIFGSSIRSDHDDFNISSHCSVLFVRKPV